VSRKSASVMVLCPLMAFYLAGANLVAGDRPGAADSNIVISITKHFSSGLELQIDYPSVFSNTLDIYVSTNLQEGGWGLRDTNLPTLGSNTLTWLDSDMTPSVQRFYRVGNADLDTDQDGLADAREILIHQTDPLKFDSDSDGVPDGMEIQRGTDPGFDGSSEITLYVDSDAGSDGFDGRSPDVVAGHGPKHSLGAASGVSYPHDVIQLRGIAVFHEPSLCIGARDVTLRPMGAVWVQP
jgi:hypothetical protein